MYQVLLADDEPIFLEFMQNIINWPDYNCRVSACKMNGRAAINYIIEQQPDIAFIDISMPLLNGIEVCQAVREREIPAKLVIMTAHDEFSFAYQAIKIGVDDYLLKPFSKEELLAALQKVILSLTQNKGKPAEAMLEKMEEGSTKYEIMSYTISEYLTRNYAKNSLTLAIIANDLGFESSYLRRVFKVTTGMTIMQKLEDIRISQAKYLLMSGKYQSQEIAEMVGFSDPFYFSRRFKQTCGMSPTEYRNQKEVY